MDENMPLWLVNRWNIRNFRYSLLVTLSYQLHYSSLKFVVKQMTFVTHSWNKIAFEIEELLVAFAMHHNTAIVLTAQLQVPFLQ